MEKYVTTTQQIRQELLNLEYTEEINSIIFLGGISNENFLINNKVVLRIPYKLNSNRDRFYNECLNLFQYEMENIAYSNNIGPKLFNYSLKRNTKLTKYLTNYKQIKFNNLSDLNLEKVIDTLKQIHSFKPSTYKELNFFDDISIWLKDSIDNDFNLKTKVVQDFLCFFHTIYDSLPKELSHCDALESNILIKDNNIKIIDFEYSSYTFKYFDLVSLLSENDINENTKQKIINYYFKDSEKEKEEFLKLKKILHKALDLYWYSWAISRKCNIDYKDKIFEEIAKVKKESFLNL